MPRFLSGMAHLQLGALDAAGMAFEAAVALDADGIEARYNLGGCYIEQGDLDRADEQFRAILELSPGHPGARAALAPSAHEREGR